MPYITINNKSLFYNFINRDILHPGKALLVFLHEGLGSSKQWKDFHINLANALKLPALYYDRYGYGKSQQVEGERSVDFLEEEAEVILPELLYSLNLNSSPLILFGHSDGGTIALLFAAKFPEKTLAVITEAAHVIVEDITIQGQRDVIKLYKTTDLPVKLARYHGKKTETMFWSWINVWQSKEMLNWTIEPKLSGIKCPVLALQGSDDNYGSPEQLASIKRHSSNSNVNTVLIPGCGHVPHHQAKEEVERQTIEFINNL